MKEISRGGSLANTLGAINPFRYRGYVYDEETGLYYLRSRYYDPNIGRFISSDSILGQVGSLLQHNLFCYCGNEVIYLIDVDGYMESAIDGGGSFFGAPIFISIDHSIFRFDFNSSENYTGIYQPVTLDYFDNVDFDIIQEVCLADIASEVLVEYYSDSYSRKIAAKRVKCSSKKEAYERAKRAGNGKEPDFHNNNKKPHYHPHVGNSVFETTHDVSKHDHYFFPVRHSILFVYRWIEEAVERWQETRKSSRNS